MRNSAESRSTSSGSHGNTTAVTDGFCSFGHGGGEARGRSVRIYRICMYGELAPGRGGDWRRAQGGGEGHVH